MATIFLHPTPTEDESRGFFSQLKGKFWHSLETPERTIRTFQMAAHLLRQPWIWTDRRLLHRLGTLERLGLWRVQEWRDDEPVRRARHDFFAAFRDLAGPRLKSIPDWPERRRLNSFLAKVESHLGVPTPYCRPTRARLELTDACNLRCPMCPQGFWDWKKNYAEEWLLDRAASLYPWINEIDLTSLGETMLSPYFNQCLERLEPHLMVQLVTNGLLVNDRNALLLAKHITELHISIDAAKTETYRKMREVESFPKVLENSRRIVRFKKEVGRGLPVLVFNFTITQKNLEDLPDVIRLASEIGFDRVHANFLSVWVPSLNQDSVYWIRERACEVLDECDELARSLGVEFLHPPKPIPEHEEQSDFHRFCAEAWEFIHLRAEDKITVCCMGAEEYHAPQGADWEAIWDGPAYQSFRKKVNLPDEFAPPLCRNCLFGRDVKPGHPRYHFHEKAVAEHIQGEVKDPFKP